MKIKLTRKLADHLDGVDVTDNAAGDILELSQREGDMLVAEGWAEPVAEPPSSRQADPVDRPVGLDRSPDILENRGPIEVDVADVSQAAAGTLERLRRIREQLEQRRLDDQERRRAEDRIREQLRESRSRIIRKTG